MRDSNHGKVPGSASGPSAADLPRGCRLRSLIRHADRRGALTEIFRDAWFDAPRPERWQAVRSSANVLRGVHAFQHSWTYFCLLSGAVQIGLHDLRPDRLAGRHSALVTLSDAEQQVMAIPPGVAHGFYAALPVLYLWAASERARAEAPLRCRWDCPELGIDWPCDRPAQEPDDEMAGNYAAFAGRHAAAAAGRAPG
jgi:dTDP-4-dehydrorhamnose 3,5-epimerase